MTEANTAIVEAAFRRYRERDAVAAQLLYAADFTFTSPQDDHIDKGAFFDRCFPTAARMTDQRILATVAANDELVLVYYEYDLGNGKTYRNVEAIIVRDGLIQQTEVFFGGQV